MDITNLKRQHIDVINLANYILDNIKYNTVEKNLNEIVKTINTITGKLKVHLLSEDQYLYPNILNSSDAVLNSFGKKYIEEMKEVTEAYEIYKSKYNTINKIKQDTENFKKDTKEIFQILLSRIGMEEKELYPLLG